MSAAHDHETVVRITTFRKPPLKTGFLPRWRPCFALNRRSCTRRDGLYRTHGPPTLSNMAGRNCLPATPSDSETHARRAHAHREQQNTPFMRLRHASGSTLQHPSSSSGHPNKAFIRSAHASWLHAANASDHARALVPAPTAAARRPICGICPRAQTRHRHAMRAGARAQHCKGG